MGPMITYHDTVALQFPLKSLHHEETPRIPKTQTLPTQDHEKMRRQNLRKLKSYPLNLKRLH